MRNSIAQKLTAVSRRRDGRPTFALARLVARTKWVLDPDNSETVIRKFQQTIFGQDKPILENQYPKLLPLDPRAETPIRADKVAIAYRRWLSDLGVTYGVIPAA